MIKTYDLPYADNIMINVILCLVREVLRLTTCFHNN